ncbi:6-hydroxymethylpterin diphosphokinase MptE-like protein [Anaerophilus nitritogenes]|uniref:motility associated factor glycosyltransferase family protein n=1 Tax=Anaerophilus nitritogenes TaxID=2498136 RepID=UPI00101C21B0|nr:6-hydroxymethylpterin diphosphokinase MptE-like protein [Anaerophilus nitritogenes]
MLIDNINILKKMYPKMHDKVKFLEQNLNKDIVRLEETRNGYKTLLVERDSKKTYIHSKYNPLKEAESIIEEYKEVSDNTIVIFYGTGLGYHIDLFLNRYPNVNYYIYEPISELIYYYLCNKSIKNLPNKNLKDIVLGNGVEEIDMFLNNVIDKSNGDILLIDFPVHKQIFSEEYKNFQELFKSIVKHKKSSLYTNYAYQKRWIINSMKNLGEVLSTPNIIMDKKGEFKDKPAILVAAGPSLNEEIENIRYIKENGLAYIFSVGSAVNTLIYHNIYPHATCAYDPTVNDQKVFQKIKEEQIKEIPIIFGSSIGYDILIEYPGDKYHMITGQDSVSNYYLKNKDHSSLDIVHDAPSIAVVAVELLYQLGFSSIILVGQNLAYKGKENYSKGIDYSNEVTEEEFKDAIKIKDVYGNEILTNDGFNRMRQQMEYYIKEFSNIRVINTTKGGAHIEGTTFMELEKIIEKDLIEPIVEKNWLEGSITDYDKDYLKSQSQNMNKAYKRALKLMDEYFDVLNKIDKLIQNRKFDQAEKMYIQLDKILKKVEKNDFYVIFILPMNRVYYKILVDSIDRLNEETNPMEKGKKIVYSFKNFMKICKDTIQNIQPIYEEMQETIDEFLEDHQ